MNVIPIAKPTYLEHQPIISPTLQTLLLHTPTNQKSQSHIAEERCLPLYKADRPLGKNRPRPTNRPLSQFGLNAFINKISLKCHMEEEEDKCPRKKGKTKSDHTRSEKGKMISK